jgi:hypothetical protein
VSDPTWREQTREQAVARLRQGFVDNPQSFWNFTLWGCAPLPLCKVPAIDWGRPRKST